VYKKRLSEVRLDTNHLMMDIMVVGVVASEHLERIPRKRVSTMIIDRLEGRHGKEKESLTGAHSGCPFRDEGSESIQKKTFYGMVV